MLLPQFEIKLALLGHVSVGKTTLLNALLGDKFSEVSMKRTTAGINHFVISSTRTNNNNDEDLTMDTGEEDIIPATKSLEIITQENAKLRAENRIQERTFEVELDEPLVPMRKHTKMVITDIPGVNEAGTSAMYLQHVEECWDTFDCVILVLDANQGVNTEEKVNLLKLVKENNEKYKTVPVIVLCNKVDDPDDEDILELVSEVRSKVEDIFQVQDTESTLERLENDQSVDDIPNVIFLPLSAENAFLYRTAGNVKSSDSLEKLGSKYLDKIGHEEIGKFKWKKLSKKRKLETVFSVVSDKDEYEERLTSTNFDKLLLVLNALVGGEENQLKLIQAQLDTRKAKLSPSTNFAADLASIYDISLLLGNTNIESLQGTCCNQFWDLFEQCKKTAWESLKKDCTNLHLLNSAFGQLEEYATGLHLKLFVQDNERRTLDEEQIRDEMINIVKKQCKISYKNKWEYKQVPYRDQVKVISSILMVRCNETFCKHFCTEIEELENQLHKVRSLLYYHEEDCPTNTNMNIPPSIEDPNHWGFLSFRFCKYMEKM